MQKSNDVYLERNNYELLANAIVLQALDDYRRLMLRLTSKKITDSERKNILIEIRRLRRWFYTDYFELLTSADGGYLLAATETKFWYQIFF